MLRAAVPEAPVDEYRHPPTREDDVHLDSDLAGPEEIVLSETALRGDGVPPAAPPPASYQSDGSPA